MDIPKCSKLSFDKRDHEYFCRSTHVCYRSICYQSPAVLVKHLPGRTETINLILEFDFDSYETN